MNDEVERCDVCDEDTLLAFLIQPSLPSYVRHVLVLCEDRGWPFEKSWAHTMRTIPKNHPEIDDWRSALKLTKARFKRAYGLRRAERLGRAA